MPGSVRVDGAWKSVAGASVNVGGSWKSVDSGWTRVGGAWKQWFSAAPASAMELIETITLTSTQTGVTFTAIPQGYKHLQIRYLVRNGTTGNTVRNTFIRFNNDSSTAYADHELAGDGSTVAASANTSRTNITLVGTTPGIGSVAGIFGSAVIDILDYSSTAKNTTVRALHGVPAATSRIALASGLWLNTSAVTQILIQSPNPDWQVGSRFSLYGIKG